MGFLSYGCLLLVVGSSSLCLGVETSWDTSCKWGGLVISKNHLELADGTCDSIHPREEWQLPPPEIKFPAAEEDKLYTVLALNPDAIDHPEGTYYLHMLHANVKGADLKNGDVSHAYNIAGYVGPALSEGEGVHRYMFVVYVQEPGFEVEKYDIPLNLRWNFNLKKWIEEHGSKLEGPVAGVQFKTGYS